MNTQFKSFLVGQGVGYTDAEGYMGDSTLSVRLDFLKKKKKKKKNMKRTRPQVLQSWVVCAQFSFYSVTNLCLKS